MRGKVEIGRERCLQAIKEVLGSTPAGRDAGLAQIRGLRDFRASVPLRDDQAHFVAVEQRLGFGSDEGISSEQIGAARERERLLRSWKVRLGDSVPRRIAILRASSEEGLLEALLMDDLRALVGEEGSLVHLAPETLDGDLEELRASGADALFVSSLATVAAIEAQLRAALERVVPSLRWIFAEYDHRIGLRSRLPIVAAGWIHEAGRLAVPSSIGPSRTMCLAVESTLIELLPHGGAPRGESGDEAQTVLPEDAIMGERYELVPSSPLGYLRKRSGLHVQVVGFSGAEGSAIDLPRPRVERLPPLPPALRLEGVTLAGDRLCAAIRQAFHPEDPALVAAEIAADPDALSAELRLTVSRSRYDPFAETELGLSRVVTRRHGRHPLALVLRLEVQSEVSSTFLSEMSRRVDRDLRRHCPPYDWLRGREELWEPRVVLAKAGAAAARRREKLRRLTGSVELPMIRVFDRV